MSHPFRTFSVSTDERDTLSVTDLTEELGALNLEYGPDSELFFCQSLRLAEQLLKEGKYVIRLRPTGGGPRNDAEELLARFPERFAALNNYEPLEKQVPRALSSLTT